MSTGTHQNGAGNLPTAVDRFVGRGAEVEELTARMREGLTLVTGLPGAGKTTTTVEAARRLLDEGDVDEAWFIDLVPQSESSNLARVIAEATGVVSRLAGDDAGETLATALNTRGDVLVILDNAEHCFDVASEIARALSDGSVLVTLTSRTSADDFPTIELSPMESGTDGVELFLERMLRNRPLHEVTDEERTIATEVVELVDGLPLGITLAASRTEIFDLPTLRDRLRDSSKVIASGAGGLEETFEWSWELLDEGARHALTQCTVFRGSFDMEAAEVVLASDAYDVVLVVHELRRNSLLAAYESHGKLRLRVLPSLAEFVGERGTPDEVRIARHREYFADLSERLAPQLERESAPDARIVFQHETENLIAAFRSAVERGEHHTARRIVEGLNEFLSQRGALAAVDKLSTEYLEAFTDDTSKDTALVALAACTARTTLGDLTSGGEALELAQSIAGAGDELLQAKVAYRASWFTWISGDTESALEICAEARAQAEASGDAHWIARTAWSEATIRQSRAEDLETTVALSEKAIEGQAKLGNLRYEGLAWSSLAVAQTAAGQSTVDAHRRALELFRRVGDQMNCAKSMSDLAEGLMEVGEWHEAEKYARQSRALARRCGLHWIDYLGTSTLVNMAIAREDWAAFDREIGRFEETRRLTRQRTFDLFAESTLALATWKRHGAAEALPIAERALPRTDQAFDILVPLTVISLTAALRSLTGNEDPLPLLDEGRELLSEGSRTSWGARMLDIVTSFCDLDETPETAEEYFSRWCDIVGPEAAGNRPFWLREIAKTTARSTPEPLKGACEWLQAHSSVGVAFYHPGHAWVRPPEGPWMEIGHRQQLMDLLDLLSTKASGATPDEIREHLWPGEQMHPKSAKNRLHAAISMLRKTGMPVEYDSSKYRLDCDLVLLR